MNNCKPSNPDSFTPEEMYHKLSPSAKVSWSKLDPESKALILSSHKHKTERPPPKPPFGDSEPKTKFSLAELHEILGA